MKKIKPPDHHWFYWSEEEITTKFLSHFIPHSNIHFLYVWNNMPLKRYYIKDHSDFHGWSKQFTEEI